MNTTTDIPEKIYGEIDEARSCLFNAMCHVDWENPSPHDYTQALIALQDAKYRMDEAESMIRREKKK